MEPPIRRYFESLSLNKDLENEGELHLKKIGKKDYEIINQARAGAIKCSLDNSIYLVFEVQDLGKFTSVGLSLICEVFQKDNCFVLVFDLKGDKNFLLNNGGVMTWTESGVSLAFIFKSMSFGKSTHRTILNALEQVNVDTIRPGKSTHVQFPALDQPAKQPAIKRVKIGSSGIDLPTQQQSIDTIRKLPVPNVLPSGSKDSNKTTLTSSGKDWTLHFIDWEDAKYTLTYNSEGKFDKAIEKYCRNTIHKDRKVINFWLDNESLQSSKTIIENGLYDGALINVREEGWNTKSILLNLIDWNDQNTKLYMRPTANVQSMANLYCRRANVDNTKVHFRFNMQPLVKKKQLDSYAIENGSTIDVCQNEGQGEYHPPKIFLLAKQRNFSTFDEISKYLYPFPDWLIKIQPRFCVYLIRLKSPNIKSLSYYDLFRTLRYYGTSQRDNVQLRFSEHCQKRGFDPKTHELIVLKTFNQTEATQQGFYSAEHLALATELAICQFKSLHGLAISDCRPGSSSLSFNAELWEKFKTFDIEKLFEELLAALSTPTNEEVPSSVLTVETNVDSSILSLAKQRNFITFDEIKKYLSPFPDWLIKIQPSFCVYLIRLKSPNIKSLSHYDLFRTLRYYGTSQRDNVQLRFSEHCQKRGFDPKTHELIVLKTFNQTEATQQGFYSAEHLALATELAIYQFKSLHGLGTFQCSPGSSSPAFNKSLVDKTANPEFMKNLYNTMISALSTHNS